MIQIQNFGKQTLHILINPIREIGILVKSGFNEKLNPVTLPYPVQA